MRDLKKYNHSEYLAHHRPQWEEQFIQLASNSWDKALKMMISL